MARATPQRRTHQRESSVVEESTVEKPVTEIPVVDSASSSVQRTRKRQSAVKEQPSLESFSSPARRTRQKTTAIDTEPKAEISPASKKRPAASENGDDLSQEAAGIVKCEGQSPSRKKVKAPSPMGVSKLEEEEKTILDLDPEIEVKDNGNEVCIESDNKSSGKKKVVSAKKAPKPEKEEDSVCIFLGNPVPDSEAKRRWPERYTKKASSRKGISSLASGNEDEDQLVGAKCHYFQAMVDGIIYNLNDDAHVKAGDDEPNYIGRIIEFFETIDGKLYFRAQWFYKAEDTVIGYHSSDHDKRRVFLSEDRNDNDLDCIVNKITIVRISSSSKNERLECDYYYDMTYSVPYSTFANLPKDDTSGVSSISTTSSEEGSDHEASSMDATLLDLYSGCGAMSTGLCHGARLAGLNLHTAWAVDINRFACESLQLNHPETKVRNEKAEDFLVLIKEWKKLCEKYSLDVKNPPKPNKEADDLSYDDGNNDSSPVPKGEFEVDFFLDICYGDPNEIGKKELMFKVRWKGYDASEDTWEPISGLSKCTERIETFVRKGYKNKILPLPGVADVICGGPPCQGISGFNRFRDSQNPLADVRNQQMEVYMEIVDFLKPKYVLMENVVDILKFAEGYLGRFALSKLVKMNYQSRLGIMAAGCYGLPQFRMRVFLWGAQTSEVLPQYPLPTHDVLVRGGAPVKFEQSIVAYNENQRAKLEKALLLGDAISDLPPVENNESRDEMPYGGKPKTDFQYSIRLTESDLVDPTCNPKEATLQRTLFDHRPLKLNDDDYMRVCRVPKKKGANFRDFPGVRVGPNNVVEFIPEVERVYLPSGSPLVPDYAMSYIKGKSPKPFGRLWWDETVPTVVTRAEPHNQIILHPEQDRVLTIRENARLQGFPDYYKLCGPIKERYIQVGNAVAVPVSRVLGYSLGRAFQDQPAEPSEAAIPRGKRPRTDEASASTALIPFKGSPSGQAKTTASLDDASNILMDTKQVRLVADINPLLIKQLEARNELGFRRLLGFKKPELSTWEINLAYFRSCITDVITGVLRYRYHHSGSYRTSEIETEIRDNVPYVVDICASALYAKLRSIHKSYGTKGTRYSSSPLFTRDIELPLPLALAIDQFGAFETHSLTKNFLIVPTFPEGTVNEGRTEPEFVAAKYLAYLPTLRELGIPCKSVDTRLKTGSPWWTYRVVTFNKTADLVCTLPASHYADLSADLRLLFLSNKGDTKKFDDLVVFPDAFKKLDYGTRDRNERSGSNIRTFLALCHGPEEEWTHGD